MINKILIVSMSIIISLTLSSCGNEEQWGIDNKSGIVLPVCNGDKNTTTNAITLIQGYTVEPLLENTNILIWHFSNSDKMACVQTGKAIMKDL